jgi:hypothetical protein
LQNIFHHLMISLSCWDLFYLIFSGICFSLPKMSAVYRREVFVHVVPYAMPVAQGSIFTKLDFRTNFYP